MKKLFTLCAAMLMGSAMAFGQVDQTFQFVDKDGNVVADGTTWTVSEKVEDLFYGLMIPSELSVKNTSGEDANVAVDFQVTQISGGAFQICFPTNCQTRTDVTEVEETGALEMAAGEVKDMATEWVVKPFDSDVEATGTCTATVPSHRCWMIWPNAASITSTPLIPMKISTWTNCCRAMPTGLFSAAACPPTSGNCPMRSRTR